MRNSGKDELRSYEALEGAGKALFYLIFLGVNQEYGYDYHFWYCANNEKEYNKHGWYVASEMVPGNVLNPSTANSSDGWKLADTVNFYSSATVYCAIKNG